MDQQNNRTLAQVLSGVAHEIRNPLQGILASVAALSCRFEGDSGAAIYVEIINKEASRINHIIDDMLELTHVVQPDANPNSVANLLDEAVRSLKEQKGMESLTIKTDYAADLPTIKSNGNRLCRAFSELLKNAGESGAQHVEISTELSPDSPTLGVLIQDDGPGIPAEIRERVLEPFFSTKKKHAGLGLCLAQHVIQQHLGTFLIESSPPGGTRVRILLPLK